jgi:uncharacterized glyoxalase superfamily protein PhnB
MRFIASQQKNLSSRSSRTLRGGAQRKGLPTVAGLCFSLALASALFFGLVSLHANPLQEKKTMHVKRITPVLLVKEIEPLLPLWMDRLGFQKTIEVPEGNKLGFVTLQKGSAEVMYQTYSSVEKDAPKDMAAAAKGPTYLYMEVEDLDAVLASTKDMKIVMPLRTAFYGMREFAIQDPGGHFITFAQPVAPPAH